ncbi:Mur ligase family protein [Helicobacter anseris]|uniref:Mur ligase family protein n=1 Tax=Helicobacter anseris TaxID=375926 RepID=UPI00147509A3|nr:Mur ligase family protein [Helicobacter anseris]
MDQKGQEYAPFDPKRAIRIYASLKKYLSLSCYKIHILGTNGKGSTGRYLALGLMQNNASVLHFSSPHILDFRERYYKNGNNISQEGLEQAHCFLQQFDFIQDCSYFEYATFLALVLAKDVDYLILEAGLGGEYDSTSCIECDLSIFTMIGKDHQEFLGKDIKDIAGTKLRAMTQLNFLALQHYNEVVEIAEQIAEQKKVTLIKIGQWHQEKYRDILDTLPENYLRDNLLNALVVLDFLKKQLPQKAYELDLRGRFEALSPSITLDVGHNIDGASEVKKALKNQKVNLIYNAYKDKDIREILTILKPNIQKIYILDIKHPRIIDKNLLCMILESLKIEYEDFKTIDTQKKYLVFGSFSVIEEFLKRYDAK